MRGKDDARGVVRRLNALGGGAEVVRKAAARELAASTAADATELLRQVIRLAREGWEPAALALPAFTRALQMEVDQLAWAHELREVAALEDQEEVELLFIEAPAQREYEMDAARRADAKLFNQPLGRLKQLARLTRNPDELTRLAVTTEPSVIRNVLLNPRLTEELVVRIAARRPARPEPLIEIWRSTRWSVRPLVRRALVFNPYLPPEVGAKIVPLLSTAELKELAGDAGLHLGLREQARLLLEVSFGA